MKKGERIKVDGNKTEWVNTASPSNTDASYWNYLEQVFLFAGTYSLDEELDHIPLSESAAGDIFIQGGFPGHAIIVMDVAVNSNTKEKKILRAQSYMPAQETHILKNPSDHNSPWYTVGEGNQLYTPEWTFDWGDLKRF